MWLTETIAKERIEMAQKVIAAAIDKKLTLLGVEQKDTESFIEIANALVAPLGVSVRKVIGMYWYEFYAVVGKEIAAGGVGGPVRTVTT